MNIAIITLCGDSGATAEWLAANNVNAEALERWIVDADGEVAEPILDALTTQWRQTPVDILLFPPGALGDELATRLAWRLQGGSVCQALSLDAPAGTVTKSHWGNALTATLQVAARPLCLSLADMAQRAGQTALPGGLVERHIATGAPPDWLLDSERLDSVEASPLREANAVLVVGQGGTEADADSIHALGNALGAEVGYSRARVMNGGFAAERMVGISGHMLAPDLCIIAGVSGAPALMAGIRQSRFIVAINRDPSAPVFSQADIGIVDDWQPVLEALSHCRNG